MSGPQLIYLLLAGVYVGFFVLFLRLFLWKHYAEKYFWRRRPQLTLDGLQHWAAGRSQELPYFSIFVPARGEAEVIHRTVEHLGTLDYPKDRYEVVVATDQKEELQREGELAGISSEVSAFLLEPERHPENLGPGARAVLLQLFARLALEESGYAQRLLGLVWPRRAAQVIPITRQRQLLREMGEELLRGRGRVNVNLVYGIVHRSVMGTGDPAVRALYPIFLSLAMPVVIAYSRLMHDFDERTITRMFRETAKASQVVTQRIIRTMAESIGHRITERLIRLKKGRKLTAYIREAFYEAYPTTQRVVEEQIRRTGGLPEFPRVRQVEVPYDFDGHLGGACTGREVPSTKGRALNYALGLADPRSTMAGFYDAESRPDRRVLLHVAWRCLQDPGLGILQGPVFQVRNFYEMSPLCKIVSLYQAVSHDWYLPVLFRQLPFVGGTNLFIKINLLRRIKGYDQTCLTEDIELGARAYLQEGVWPEYLPYPSSEQTPATFRAFFRQRLRWGTGYLQVVEKIREERRYAGQRRSSLLRNFVLHGQLQWVLYQLAALIPIVVWFLWWRRLVDPSILPWPARLALNLLSLVYLGFTFYTYHRYAGHLDAIHHPHPWLKRLEAVTQLLLLPISAFFLPVPYSSALVLRALHRDPKQWVKTPRTRE